MVNRLAVACTFIVASNVAAEPSAQIGTPATAERPTVSAPMVARAQFTSGVQDHEPIDNLSEIPSSAARVYFFTDVRNLAGQTIVHRWERNGTTLQEIPLMVGGNRWRTYSYRVLDATFGGEWKASVVDATGGTLAASTLTQTSAAAKTVPLKP